MSHAEILGKAISNTTSDSRALSPVLSPQVQHSADIVGIDQGQGDDDTCLDTIRDTRSGHVSNQLSRCLRIYATIDRVSNIEKLVREEIVKVMLV